MGMIGPTAPEPATIVARTDVPEVAHRRADLAAASIRPQEDHRLPEQRRHHADLHVRHVGRPRGRPAEAEAGVRPLIDERQPLERRYLVVAADGRHTTLGRETEPDDEALDTASEGLDSLGLAGWYVLSEGRYYVPDDNISLLPIRRLTSADGVWDAAAAEFHRRRTLALER